MMGSGGVGGYYGARLLQAGHEVAFVARGAHAQAMRKKGLRIRSELGDAHLSVRVIDDPAQAGPTDLAVIAEPGIIAQTGKLQRVTLGELDGSRTPRLQAAVEAFRSAGVETIASDDIVRVTWEKFVFLSALSGLTALTRKPIGDVRAHPVTRSMLLDALREAVALARAEGAGLDEGFAQKQLEVIDGLPPAMLSSMAQDLLRGRRLELPWLSGAIVRRAEAHKLRVPTHHAIYGALVLHAG